MTQHAIVPTGSPTRRDPLTVWGFVLAVVLAPLGLVVSIVAASRSKQRRGSADGLAVAGVVLSAVGTFMLVVVILPAVAIPVYLSQRAASQQGELGTLLAEAVSAGVAYQVDYQSQPTSTDSLGLGPVAPGYTVDLVSSDATGFCVMGTTPTGVVLFMDESRVTSPDACP